MQLIDSLKSEFNQYVSLKEKRPGTFQLVAPLFHEDGDMVDIFLSQADSASNSPVQISDCGLTLMRLSYSYDLDTPTKRKIFDRILAENGVREEQGRLFIEASQDKLYPAILQFAQTVSKVCNMQLFKREVIRNLFYETLADFVQNSLARFHPKPDFAPIENRDDLEVDWHFTLGDRPIFLYGVKDNAKSRLAALACREFERASIRFRSVIVHEDFENGISKKDQSRITNAADKQFTTLEDFMAHAPNYFDREAAA